MTRGPDKKEKRQQGKKGTRRLSSFFPFDKPFDELRTALRAGSFPLIPLSAVHHWLAVLGWMAAIVVLPWFLGSSVPSSGSVRDELIHSGIHMVEYGVLALLLHRALTARLNRKLLADNPGPRKSEIRNPHSAIYNWRPYWLAFLLAPLYAVFDEIQQAFIPNRQPSLLDVLADSLGSLLALAVIAFVSRLWLVSAGSLPHVEAREHR